MMLKNALQAGMISLVVGVVVLVFKWIAFWLTGSVALYSDALESFVNVAAAAAMLIALKIAHQPADQEHPFGHSKAEYFSAILESMLIGVAALATLHEAVSRLLNPMALEAPLIGLMVSFVASLMNGFLAWFLLKESKTLNSPALKADGLHILSDVITSIGIWFGVGLAWLTGWWLLDPLLAMGVAIHILWMGWNLLKDSVDSLMDKSMNIEDLSIVKTVISREMTGALQVHHVRTRQAGKKRFIEFHLVVPATMQVIIAHEICDRLELALEQAFSDIEVTIHVEPEEQAIVHDIISPR
jgi:cation diffusion facilitator family transporter